MLKVRVLRADKGSLDRLTLLIEINVSLALVKSHLHHVLGVLNVQAELWTCIDILFQKFFSFYAIRFVNQMIQDFINLIMLLVHL